MTLWLILAAMTAVAVFAVLWPLTRRATAAPSGSDVAVYRDQLGEVERDLTAGLIGPREAEAARIEISRRLLAAADADRAVAQATSAITAVPGRRRAIAIASLVAVPLIAGTLYLQLGSPELASAQSPASDTAAAAAKSIETLVAQAEEHLRRNPDDGHAWEVLAPVYMQLDRYSDSVTAWRSAIRILGENAERDADLAESLTAEANGVVTADAKASFTRAAALDDNLVSPRYYLGLAAEQDGRREDAAKIWGELIAKAPAGAQWIGEVREALARVEGKANETPGPDSAQMAAAANAPPEQQAPMIQAMVERLATRLKQDGSDAAGWAQLVRSYNVLNQPDKARATIADAQQALASAPDKLAQFNAALKTGGTAQAAAAVVPAPPSPAGPDAAQIAASANQPPDQQAAMIQGMVDGLAARLKQDGTDVAGWLRLIHSYTVLNQPDKARAATADAQKALADNPAKLAELDAGLKDGDGDAGAAAAPKAENFTPRPQPAPPSAHDDAAAMQGMVDRLAQRLKNSGSDPAGWLMLVRSYATLGQKEKATAAINDARQALASNPQVLEDFNAALKNFKIGE